MVPGYKAGEDWIGWFLIAFCYLSVTRMTRKLAVHLSFGDSWPKTKQHLDSFARRLSTLCLHACMRSLGLQSFAPAIFGKKQPTTPSAAESLKHCPSACTLLTKINKSRDWKSIQDKQSFVALGRFRLWGGGWNKGSFGGCGRFPAGCVETNVSISLCFGTNRLYHWVSLSLS